MIETMSGPGWEIEVVVGDEPIDSACDAVDVIVKFEGGTRHHAAVFGTVAWIQERMSHHRSTGESASGLYFWTADLIIVERLTLDVIRRTVEDLLRLETFDLAFSEPSFDIEPEEGSRLPNSGK